VAVVVLAAAAVVAIAIVSDEDGGKRDRTASGPKTGSTSSRETPAGPGSSGKAPSSQDIDRLLGRRRLVQAPPLTAQVLDKGALAGPVSKTLTAAFSDGSLNLDELHGTPVVLSLWGSWCDPCRPAVRAIQTQAQRLGARGVLFLGLDVQDSAAAARRFRSELDLTYPSVRDMSGGEARRLGARSVPETFFISPAEQIVGHIVGAASVSQLELGAMAAQASKPIGLQQGGARLPLR
jgi:thiol-disulfide isomerase/thioredoxin